MSDLLVVAGEASGDAMAAPVVRKLGARAFGVGGRQLRDAGAEILGAASDVAAVGPTEALGRAPAIAGATLRLVARAGARRPSAALLVGFSEVNARLGPLLRRLGTRVLWYSPPQVWAWRRRRGKALTRACDRMAVTLPFEEALWQRLGADAEYVGHPALERVAAPEPEETRSALRERLGFGRERDLVALLPGSRNHEVRRHLEPMLAAIALMRRAGRKVDAVVVLASTLGDDVDLWACGLAARAGAKTIRRRSLEALPAFDAALVASGTATLECALARVPPVIVYRTSEPSFWIARALVQTAHVGLPNVLLGARVFPELLQHAVTAEAIAGAAATVLSRRPALTERCDRVRALLSARAGPPPSERVAAMIAAWL